MSHLRELSKHVRHHVCSVCGRADVWGPTWLWYGSYQDEDDGKVVKFCSRECAAKSRFGAPPARIDR